MKYRLVSLLLAGSAVTASGCFLHPPYGEHFNATSTLIPPVESTWTHVHNLPPAEQLMEPGPGVGGPGPGVMVPPMLAANRRCRPRRSLLLDPTAWRSPGMCPLRERSIPSR